MTTPLVDCYADDIVSTSADSSTAPAGPLAAVSYLLEFMGEDVKRPGLQKTPQRYLSALAHLTSGYKLTLSDVVGDALYANPRLSMSDASIVIVRNISFSSTCEHHLLPFYGNISIGYVPKDRVLGLSKFARIVDLFAHRLQLQERLTLEIANAISECTDCAGVAVHCRATHMCMVARGVCRDQSTTVSLRCLGTLDEQAKRSEFLSLLFGGEK